MNHIFMLRDLPLLLSDSNRIQKEAHVLIKRVFTMNSQL